MDVRCVSIASQKTQDVEETYKSSRSIRHADSSSMKLFSKGVKTSEE